MATSLRPTLPYSPSRDSQDTARPSPKIILTPASSREESLKSETPPKSPPNTPSRRSRRVLFSYQHVFYIFRKSTTSLSSLIRQKTTPERKAGSVTMATAQPKSIVSLKLDRLKDKWYSFKRRASPRGCRCAGLIFLVMMLLILGAVVVGWYGLSKDTLAHEIVTIGLPQTTPIPVDHHDPSLPTPTLTEGPWEGPWNVARKGIPYPHSLFFIFESARALSDTPQDITIGPTVPAAHLVAAELKPTTSSEDVESATIVRTIIVTVTTVITDTSLKTLTTTVILSTCTTCNTLPTTDASTSTTDSKGSTTDSVMTGIMYCSFTGRRNIYTLCPRVHTDSPAMLTDTPAAVSSGTSSKLTNPFSAVRLAAVTLWNSIPSLARVLHQTRDHQDKCACDCASMNKRLETAIHLVRMQQKLLESQRTLISNHRKGLNAVLETLKNMTATRAGERAERTTAPLDLNI
ncbi:hypothetical protein F5Y08DRAFT_353577 [Xylaria arbuscula]|nr:hypothetical protein F5Y08DRAFT_353577 [Xylaria arbuscula]